jgi:molybdopterin converting factor small subunit
MSSLKDVTGTGSAELPSSFDTFEKVMDELLRLFPKLKDEMFYPDGSIDFIYQVVLNGRRLSWPEDKHIKVRNGDKLIFLIFMAGG